MAEMIEIEILRYRPEQDNEPWMQTFQQAMSFPLFATSGYMLWTLGGMIDDFRLLAAIMGLTRGMAKELASKKIRVNTLVPGPTNTPMMQGIPQEWADAIIAGVPMGRMAEPEDIAKVAVFLASDDSGFVTGQNVAVNGGSAFL